MGSGRGDADGVGDRREGLGALVPGLALLVDLLGQQSALLAEVRERRDLMPQGVQLCPGHRARGDRGVRTVAVHAEPLHLLIRGQRRHVEDGVVRAQPLRHRPCELLSYEGTFVCPCLLRDTRYRRGGRVGPGKVRRTPRSPTWNLGETLARSSTADTPAATSFVAGRHSKNQAKTLSTRRARPSHKLTS